MTKRQYVRNMDRSYMVLTGPAMEESYEENMLRENRIRALLPFYTVEHNGEIQYWYDISGMRSVKDFVSQEGLTEENLYGIILALGIALEEADRYLIGEDHLKVDPDTVYLERKGKSLLVRLCFFPGENPGLKEAVGKITEYFLTVADHGKEGLTKKVYALYDEAAGGDFRYEDLVELVSEGMVPAGQEEEARPKEEDAEVERDPAPAAEERGDYRPKDYSPQPTGEEEAVYAEAEEGKEEKEGGPAYVIRTYLQDFIKGIKEDLSSFFGAKFGKYRKEKEEKREDFVYDPSELYEEEPTLFLGKQDKEAEGRLLYEGRGDEDNFSIRGESIRIGSSQEGNDLILHSHAVSRHHAVIRKERGAYFLEDLNSTNATFVNGDIVAYQVPVRLNPGDKVKFADVEYSFL